MSPRNEPQGGQLWNTFGWQEACCWGRLQTSHSYPTVYFFSSFEFCSSWHLFFFWNSLKQTRLWGTFLAVKFWVWTIVKKTPFSCAHKQLLKRMRFAFSKSMRIKTKAAWAHRKVSFFWWGQNKTLQQKWHQRLRQCFKNRI